MLAFIDIRKAFDRVWRDDLFSRLYKGGVQEKMFRMIQEIYKDSSSVVNVDNVDSELFAILLRVGQGDAFSSFQFAIFIDSLIDELKRLEIELDEEELTYMVNRLLYVDDWFLIAKNGEE
eukprot:Awhi_evm1s9446